ncbi:LINE-1 reverse transcriptase homolog [Elysia marginata]|uniref:LINE-1 reverse transcriptase homolog n=1 Tax=Elysia marginata TaxID=1093978 RepID=A0AAV4IHB9_9GAST|nr:LINE-1 reverse transcriptase homolog [Elysia marginata]
MCILATIYNKMILNRIRTVINPRLHMKQNGFCSGRSIVAQMLTLRRVIDGVKANILPAIIIFIDFKKAFDSIHKAKMVRTLKAYGIPHLQPAESQLSNEHKYKGKSCKA